MPKAPIVEMRDIEKSFHGVKALNGLSMDLYPGEVHCLVGENGAGKSTLIKVLTGAHLPNRGTIIVDGVEYPHMTAALSKKLGIGVVYQENLLVPWMSVVENIFVGQEMSRLGVMRHRDEVRRAQELLEKLGLKLKLNQMVANMSVSDQQFLKIIKAISMEPRILIMDEPTSMFNATDAGKVLDLVRRISKQGVSVIYISHFLKEVKQIADRITVIRDGKSIRTYDNRGGDVELDSVVSDMVGRSATMFYQKEQYEIGGTAFEVKDLRVTPDGEPVSFDVRRGEILGVAGMVGAGRTEIANAIFGVRRKYGGRILYEGKELQIKSPRDSVRHRIAYITEDRQKLGLNLNAPVVENLTEVGMQTTIPGFFIRVRNLIPLVRGIIDGLKIKLTSPMMAARNLSGGNQQKVVLGKWLFSNSDIFLFDEPTRGIDVNSKAEFYRVMTELAKEGKTIIMISSDMPELISISDRVMVIAKGRIVKILEKDEISENSIIRYALEVHTA
ncbi:sugar ABC transporter ATP-binding protein [bacterium]|nr:sugar ABC transporter ATP-binding protein [bacterium]